MQRPRSRAATTRAALRRLGYKLIPCRGHSSSWSGWSAFCHPEGVGAYFVPRQDDGKPVRYGDNLGTSSIVPQDIVDAIIRQADRRQMQPLRRRA